MNKKTIFALGIIWSGIILQAGDFTILPMPTENTDLWPIIQKAQERFFGDANVFEKNLSDNENRQQKRYWEQALTNLQSYVSRNAKGFLNIAQLAKKVGFILASTVTTGCEQVFSDVANKRKTQQSAAYQQLENNILDLLRRKKELQNYKIGLQKSMTIQVLPVTQVKSLLQKVLPFLENTIEKVVFDFVKESQIYGFSPNSMIMKQIKNSAILTKGESMSSYLQ
ncbi:MAG: SNF2-related protein [Candidatus Babeliales bacterium]